MANPYIPPRDVDLVTWADNFSALITAAPATYGLVAGDATIIAAAVVAWDAAYALAVNPTTRTPTTVAAKNTAKQAMLPILRTYASQIRLNAGVADADKIALGLNLPNNNPSPIPAPSTQPILNVTNAEPLRHVMRFRDTGSPSSSRAKAPNTIGMELWRFIGTAPATDPTTATFYGMAVKVPFNSEFTSDDAGKLATYFGRWANRAGSAGNNIALVGPWSAAITQTIVGTG
jgi:hypothetical protein